MYVRAIGSLGIEGFDEARANNLHSGGNRRQVTIRFLFPHFTDSDKASRHEGLLCDRTFSSSNYPREILAGTDFKRNGEIIGKHQTIRFVSQHLASVLCNADECTLINLLL